VPGFYTETPENAAEGIPLAQLAWRIPHPVSKNTFLQKFLYFAFLCKTTSKMPTPFMAETSNTARFDTIFKDLSVLKARSKN